MSSNPDRKRLNVVDDAKATGNSGVVKPSKQHSQTERVFVREATGLVKSVSLLNSIALNISNMSAGAALATIGFTMILLPSVAGVNLVYGSLIAFALSIPQILVYSTMNRKVSRTGGDYVWVSRTLGGLFGSAISFMGYTLETLAYLALIALSAVFAIGSVGVSLGYQNMLGLSLPGNIPGASTLAQFIVATALFGALILVNILRPNLGYRIVTILTVVGIATTVLAIGVLLSAGNAGVQNYIAFLDSIGFNKSYSGLASSYVGSGFNLNATLFILPFFAIFVYPWLNASPAVAAEAKSKNVLKWGVPIAAIIAMLLVTGAFATMYYVGGFGFVNAALSNPGLVNDYSFNFWTLAMGVSGSTILASIIGLGWIIWNIAILAYGIIVFSRYLFAQAFDRFLPEKLAYISPKYGSPIVAHIIDFVITTVLIGSAAFLYGPLSTLYGAVVAAMIYFAVVGVAAVVYGVRREKGRDKGVLTVAGVLMTAVFAFITYEFLAYPQVWGGNALAYVYVAGSFIAGLLIYGASKIRHGKRGIDISLAYKEIPPE
jgi:amino acid transporter